MCAKANRNQSAGKPASGPSTARDEVSRLLARGKAKDAIKQAKLLHRSERSDESHSLLERAYLQRIRELRAGGLDDSARDVAVQLVDHGVRGAEPIPEVIRLFLGLGLSGEAQALQSRSGGGGLDPAAFLKEAADRAVRDPDRAPADPPWLRATARLVRSAIAAEAQGRGEEAEALLREVPRSSPFADWRMFVRGLVARGRGDLGAARDAWKRLDPDRPCARAAKSLLALSDPSGPEGPPSPEATRDAEAGAFGTSMIARVHAMAELAAAKDWRGLFRAYRETRPHLERRFPHLERRMERVLYSMATHQAREATTLAEREKIIDGFLAAAGPFDWDPRGNRLRALSGDGEVWEPGGTQPHWRAYLKDLDTLPLLAGEEERDMARALVWIEIGRDHAYDHDAIGRWAGLTLRERQERDQARTDAILAYENAIRLAPGVAAGYEALVAAFREWHEETRVEGVLERLVRNIPDHGEGWKQLARTRLTRGDGIEAASAALKARGLKPLDPKVAQLAWLALMEAARQRAIRGEREAGEEAIRTAAAIAPQSSANLEGQAAQAAFAAKVGDLARSTELVTALRDRNPGEPAPPLLALSRQWARYGLPEPSSNGPRAQLKAALDQRPSPATAASCAAMIREHHFRDLPADAEWPAHCLWVAQYLDRASRAHITFTTPQLQDICLCVILIKGFDGVLSAFAKKGRKLDESNPVFPLCLAEVDLRLGDEDAKDRAWDLLLEAEDLVQEWKDPDAQFYRELITLKLDALEAGTALAAPAELDSTPEICEGDPPEPKAKRRKPRRPGGAS